MHYANRPAYWQLDLFTLAMLGLMIAIMRAHLHGGWAITGAIASSVLCIAGMALWVWGNWAALVRDEQRAVRIRQHRHR